MESFENDLEDRCVDFFVRNDGTFGFEEYRRDHEEGSHGTRYFADALAASREEKRVPEN